MERSKSAPGGPRARGGSGHRGRRGPWRILAGGVAVAVLALLVAPWAPLPANSAAPERSPIASATTASDWTTFHGGENRSGFSPIDGPTVGAILTEFVPSGGAALPVRAGVVANSTNVFATDDLGGVYEYARAPNWTKIWGEPLGTTPTTPSLVGNQLLVGGSDGDLAALWASNGSIDWSRAVGGAIPQGVSVANGEVFVGTGAGEVWALDLATGAPLWNRSIGAPAAGALALEGTTIVAATSAGSVVALTTSGVPLWNVTPGAALASGPAVEGGQVVVGDDSGNVTDLRLADGGTNWQTNLRPFIGGDAVHSTPAMGNGAVYVSTELGDLVALNQSNGSVLWHHSFLYTGYAALSSPAATPNGIYFSDQTEDLIDLAPSDGHTIWSVGLGYAPAYAPVAIDGGQIFEGTDYGVVFVLGNPQGPPSFRVSGVVWNGTSGPVGGAEVQAGYTATFSAPNGSFNLTLPNGTYEFGITASDYFRSFVNVTVAGPASNLTFVLTPVPIVAVFGTLRDSHSNEPLANATVSLQGEDGFVGTTRTRADGSFQVAGTPGTDYLTVDPPDGYAGLARQISVAAVGEPNLTLRLDPTTLTLGSTTLELEALLPVAAIGAAVISAAAADALRRRREEGLPEGLLGPFGEFVAMRLAIIPVQLAAVLSVLYVFGTMLPAVVQHVNACTFVPNGCDSGPWSWSNPWEVAQAFAWGLRTFLFNLATGNWGNASYGRLTLPAAQFLQWWLPDSVELALFALPMAAVLAYFVGLYSGAKRDGTVDVGARLLSIAGLLIPSFIVVLLFLGTFYNRYVATFGDTPYGLLPTSGWFIQHGGYPSWIGSANNTTPTGLPVLDGVIHHDWPFEQVVVVKVLWQALAIAAVYVAIFLRYARNIVAEAFREPHLAAARARGIDESTLLWKHTGRRVLPLMLLVFGVTLPMYIGTQALVEAMANDTGVGALLIAEMTQVGSHGFGFSAVSNTHAGNVYQVTIFILVIVVLLGNLCADVAARYMDPRLSRIAR